MEVNMRHRTSFLWNFFTVTDMNEKLGQCDLCKQTLCFKSTISNLKKHIDRKHPNVNLRLKQDVKRQSESESELSQVPTTSEVPDSDQANQLDTVSFEEVQLIEPDYQQPTIKIQSQSDDDLDDRIEYTHVEEHMSSSSNESPVTRKTMYRKLASAKNMKHYTSSNMAGKKRKTETINTNNAVEQKQNAAIKLQEFDNELECFGKLVVCQLQKLPEAEALESMAYIHSYLIKKRLGQMDSK